MSSRANKARQEDIEMIMINGAKVPRHYTDASIEGLSSDQYGSWLNPSAMTSRECQ